VDPWQADPWRRPYQYQRFKDINNINLTTQAKFLKFTLTSQGRKDGFDEDDYVRDVTVNSQYIRRVRVRTWEELRDIDTAINAYYEYIYDKTTKGNLSTTIGTLIQELKAEGLLPDEAARTHLKDEYENDYLITRSGVAIRVSSPNFQRGFQP